MTDEQKYCFAWDSPLDIPQSETETQKRTFSGVAYSGKPITDHWAWDNVIFDIESMELKDKTPVLLDHDTDKRVGVVMSYEKTAQGLAVSGDLLNNEYGRQIAQDSDGGFPWQMSVRIKPMQIEEIKEGTVVVNGQTYQAPITVFRGGKIHEISFCVLGADKNTSAVAASDSETKTQPDQEDETVNELEQAKARIAELEQERNQYKQERDDVQNAFAAFKAEKRQADIADLEKELEKQFSDEDKANLLKMDDGAFAFMAAQMRDMKPAKPARNVPPHLFSHQATGGTTQDTEHRFTAGAKAFAAQNKE